MAGTPQDILNVTEQELGNTNGAKYFNYFGYGDLGDWCMASALYCVYKGSATLDWPPKDATWKRFVVPDKHDCPPSKWLDKGQLFPGSLVFFDWDDDTWGDHVGIVKSVQDWGCVTREGNTGNPPAYRERQRTWDCILGGMTPNFRESKSQWVKEGGRWWYRHADGSYTRNGWEKIDGKWYRFDKDGWMLEDTCIKVDGKWYALSHSGAMIEKAVAVNQQHDGTYGSLVLS